MTLPAHKKALRNLPAGADPTQYLRAADVNGIVDEFGNVQYASGKGVPGGYCPLDGSSLVPSANVQGTAITATGAGGSHSLADHLATLPDAKITATGSSAARSLAARFADVANVRDYGAKDDGATDCTPALLSAAAAVNFAGTVRFPGTAASVYYFSLFYANQFPGVTFDVDDGVVLSTNGDDVMATTAEALRFARPTRFYWRTLQRYYIVGRSALLSGAHPPPTKDLWVDDSAFNRASSEAVLCNTAAITPRKILWPTSDTWEADGFASTTASEFRFAAGVDSYFHVGMRRVLPGDALMASMGIYSGQPYLVAMLRTTGGLHVVYATPDDVATSIDLAAKALGVSATDAALSPPWKGNHASYAPANAVWSIRIDAWDRAAFLLNGYPLATIKLNGYVVEAGFGMMGRTSSDSLVIRDVVVTHRAPPTNGTLVSVRVFGDSRSAPRYDCWPDYLPTALEYTAGMRVWKVDNQAVAGQNSTQQLAVLTSVGVSDVDVVVIDVGTNDVQGLVLVDTFRSNLTAMVNAVQAAGKTAVLVNFDLWYTQGQAGTGHGQASLNYQAGAPYRSALLRVAAEKGVRVVDAPSLDGPILAHFVTSGLGLDLTAAGDPTLSDNIHPTTMLTRLRAREIAKAIAGALLPAPGVLALHNVELAGANGWATSLQRVFAQVNASGEVTLGGLFNDPGGATRTNGTVVTTLPLNLRPLWTVRAKAWTDTADNIYVNIDSSTGQVTVYGLSTAGYFGIDGITYALDDRPPY